MPTQTRRMILRSLIGATICAGFPVMATAGEGCCSRCGCSAKRCRKICRLVQEDRKITTTCWAMECEDFCVPGPSTPDCKHCEIVCSTGPDDNDICVKPKRLFWISWIPACDTQIFTKRKLMKKTVITTVPSFKWVVEDACQECLAAIKPIRVSPGSTILPAPQIKGAVVVAGQTAP